MENNTLSTELLGHPDL